jgi:hypothetical protein
MMSFGLGLGLGFGALCVSCSMVSLFFSPPGSVQLVSSCVRCRPECVLDLYFRSRLTAASSVALKTAGR